MFIAFDTELKRPGCVLIQAAMGGTISDFLERFPSDTWIINMTDDMKLFPVTEDQLDYLQTLSMESTANQKESP